MFFRVTANNWVDGDRITIYCAACEDKKSAVYKVCYEAIKRLPVERQPNDDLLLRWQLSARSIREQFHYRHNITRSLYGIMADKCIGMLLATDQPPEPMYRTDSDHSNWNRRTMHRARRFIRIFMTYNYVNARNLARFGFLPPRIWEWLRVFYKKAITD